MSADVVPINFPEMLFNFKYEAAKLAVNEACSGTGVECAIDTLCPECKALANVAERTLVRAFLAGQSSIVVYEPKEPLDVQV